MTPDMIRQLPAGHALIVRGGYSPVVARLGVAWKDRAYKTARRRRGSAIAALTPAPEPSALDGTAEDSGPPEPGRPGCRRPGPRGGTRPG